MTELEAEYNKKGGSGKSSEEGYSVEALYDFYDPRKIGKQIFDKSWRTVQFDEAQVGVPQSNSSIYKKNQHGLYTYCGAQALRWWFHAAAEINHDNICLATRLVKHTIVCTHEVNAVSYHDHIHGDDRSNMFPDWGKTTSKKGG